MTKKEMRVYALRELISFADMLCEGVEQGELSDNLREDIEMGRIAKRDARKVQIAIHEESRAMSERMYDIIRTYNPEERKRYEAWFKKVTDFKNRIVSPQKKEQP